MSATPKREPLPSLPMIGGSSRPPPPVKSTRPEALAVYQSYQDSLVRLATAGDPLQAVRARIRAAMPGDWDEPLTQTSGQVLVPVPEESHIQLPSTEDDEEI